MYLSPFLYCHIVCTKFHSGDWYRMEIIQLVNNLIYLSDYMYRANNHSNNGNYYFDFLVAQLIILIRIKCQEQFKIGKCNIYCIFNIVLPWWFLRYYYAYHIFFRNFMNTHWYIASNFLAVSDTISLETKSNFDTMNCWLDVLKYKKKCTVLFLNREKMASILH